LATGKPTANYYLVQIWADGSGWNIFRPLTDDNRVKATLDAVM
jgi:hypothetical protein